MILSKGLNRGLDSLFIFKTRGMILMVTNMNNSGVSLDGSSGFNLENLVKGRRNFLKGGLAVGAAALLGLGGCATGHRDAVIPGSHISGRVDSVQTVAPNSSEDLGQAVNVEYKSVVELQNLFQHDILNFSEATTHLDNGANVLSANADYVRSAYESKQFKGKEHRLLGALAFRYTNLVACSLARDMPDSINSVDLDTIVKLDIARTIASNKNLKEYFSKQEKIYSMAYGKVDTLAYNSRKDQILAQYKLTEAYKDCKNLGNGIFKFAGELVDHIEPFDDIWYGLEHSSLPSTPVAIRQSKLNRGSKVSSSLDELADLQQRLTNDYHVSLTNLLNVSPIGSLAESSSSDVGDKSGSSFMLNVPEVETEVINYNNSLASSDLAYGQKINTLINLSVDDNKIYSKSQRAQLAMAGGRLKTGLAWQEKVEADRSYAKFESGGDQNDLARAASHALAAYVLAFDSYDQSVFKGMLNDCHKQMKELDVSSETKTKANVEVLFPYYLDELKGRKDKAFLTGMWGGVKLGTSIYSAVGALAGTAGTSGASMAFSVAGGGI